MNTKFGCFLFYFMVILLTLFVKDSISPKGKKSRRPLGRPVIHGRYSRAYTQFREAYRRIFGPLRRGRPRVLPEPGWSGNPGPTGDIPQWSPPPLSPTTLPGSPTRSSSTLSHPTVPAIPSGSARPPNPASPIAGPSGSQPPLTHQTFPASPSGSPRPSSPTSPIAGPSGAAFPRRPRDVSGPIPTLTSSPPKLDTVFFGGNKPSTPPSLETVILGGVQPSSSPKLDTVFFGGNKPSTPPSLETVVLGEVQPGSPLSPAESGYTSSSASITC
ncbi:uncharacterized protein LOC142765966 [Rhipicephalus microplus]|uniref:uncharacterized protein LOC142765966 n=1 Tax=Rhipicephalus microplus TaxID=6941 RepID=UPI003F6B0824